MKLLQERPFPGKFPSFSEHSQETFSKNLLLLSRKFWTAGMQCERKRASAAKVFQEFLTFQSIFSFPTF